MPRSATATLQLLVAVSTARIFISESLRALTELIVGSSYLIGKRIKARGFKARKLGCLEAGKPISS